MPVSLRGGGIEGAITVDGDGQHKMEDILKVSDAMQDNPKALVLGCRCFDGENVPARSRWGNKLSVVVFKCLCGINLSDTQTGLRGIPLSFLPVACGVAGERYEYETNFLLCAHTDGMQMLEIPICTVYENNNEVSHFHPLRDSFQIYSALLRFCGSSLLGALVDYGIFWLLLYAKVPILGATYLARCVSGCVNFACNRRVVFKSRGKISGQVFKYIVTAIIISTLSGLGVTALNVYLSFPPVLAKLLVDTILYFASYYVQANYIFKRAEEQ